MKKRLGALAGPFLVLLVAAPVFADLPRPPWAPKPDRFRHLELPPQPPQPTVPLVIEASDSVKEPRLKIPRKLLGQLRAQADHAGPDLAVNQAGASFRTVVAGIALSLSLAAGGLWLVRTRGRARTGTLLLLLALALPGAGGAVLWASPPLGKLFGPKPAPSSSEKVIVEIVDEGETLQLTVNRTALTRLVGQGK
jgi:hypothetical protein